MALFDSEDPAADFLSREQDIIGDVISTDQFEVINQSESMPMSEAEPLDFVPSDELVTDGALETEVSSQELAFGSGFEPAMTFDEDPVAPAQPEAAIVFESDLIFEEYAPVPDNFTAPDPFTAEPAPVPAPEPVAEPEFESFFEPVIEPVIEPAVQDNDNIYAAMREASEPESIRKWKEEQAEEIAARDADSEVQKEEWKAAAKQELEDWYARQNDVLDKNKAGNREAQEDFLKEQSESKPGQQWEKICKLCDFNPKSNRNSKDTSRMRGLFLQLKQTPLVR